MQRKSKGFKRSGLHRFECSCGNYTYCTVAAVERFGLPVCPCGLVFQPARIELAFLLGVEDCPVMEEFRREASSVMHGQAWTGNYGAQAPENVVAERMEERRKVQARSNRLAALVPAVEIPF